MFEKFTDRSGKVMGLANQEAQRFNHEYIGTEHILLGLVKEGSGVGAGVLKNFGVDLKKVRLEVEKLLPSGPDTIIRGKIPLTPRATKVAEYANEEARNLGHNYVGTEHLLLGLLRDPESTAVKVLLALGLQPEKIRKAILNLIGDEEVESDVQWGTEEYETFDEDARSNGPEEAKKRYRDWMADLPNIKITDRHCLLKGEYLRIIVFFRRRKLLA